MKITIFRIYIKLIFNLLSEIIKKIFKISILINVNEMI